MAYRRGAGRDEAQEVGCRQIIEPCAKLTDLSLSLKDSKQGMDVSRFAIEHAAPGSRWSGVSQTGDRKSSQNTAVGEHARYEENFFTENAS